MKKILIWLKKPKLLHRIRRKLIKFFFFEQWILLLASAKTTDAPAWENFTALLPPLDRIWADPFIWIKDEQCFIFYEEQFLSTFRGRISCITLDEEMRVSSNRPVLERPYHLSYPFIFEYDSELYMLPESKENKGIELYKSIHFPDKWELDRILMPNISAVDTTLVQANGKWWLFTNIEEKGGSSWDSLYLFYADSPLSTEWTAHPKNPIVVDIQNSRPAGRIFLRDEHLIRPAQDCSVRYGYATNFNRIITLTETEYEEVYESSFKPQPFSKYYATHTWSEIGNLRVIDAQMWRSKR